ncbi:sensor domain-containing diguanylate cyclase [Roseospira navarrensis]|nr:sensor domain-containing diguanylate cyclase [Roseospira navarrensis]
MSGAPPFTDPSRGLAAAPVLEALFHQNACPVAFVGADLVMIRANETFAAFLGRPAETLAGQRVDALGLPDSLLWMMDETVDAGRPADLADVPIGAAGGESPRSAAVCTLRLEPVRDGEGRCCGVLLLGTDVTTRRRTARALAEKEAEYRLLAEQQSALMVKIDAEGRFLYVNPAYCETFGRTSDELIGQTFMPLVHEEDRAATAAAMARLVDPPHSVHLEQRAWTVHGWRWLAWQDTALVDEAGRIQAIIGVAHDITEQRTARAREQQSLENLRAFFTLSQDLLLVVDGRGRVREMNDAVTDRLGWRRADLLGRSVFRLLARRSRADGRARIRAIASGRARSVQFLLRHREGAPVLVETRVVAGTWDDAPALFTSSRDLSELSLLREKFERVFLDNATLMAITDPQTGRFLDVNNAFLRLLDMDRADVIGRTTVELGFFPNAEGRLEILRDADDRARTHPIEMGVKLPDGRNMICEWTTALITSGGTSYRLTMLNDISRQHELLVELEYQANHDSLTGAVNRQRGARHLDHEVLRSRRQGAPLSVILADVDHFKGINDRHGHGVGDRVLQEIVRVLTDRLRETDILARWGGEEFVILLPDTDRDGAVRLAEALRAGVESAAFATGDRVTLSLGAALLQDGETAESVIDRADRALYQAKRGGRNRVEVDGQPVHEACPEGQS